MFERYGRGGGGRGRGRSLGDATVRLVAVVRHSNAFFFFFFFFKFFFFLLLLALLSASSALLFLVWLPHRRDGRRCPVNLVAVSFNRRTSASFPSVTISVNKHERRHETFAWEIDFFFSRLKSRRSSIELSDIIEQNESSRESISRTSVFYSQMCNANAESRYREWRKDHSIENLSVQSHRSIDLSITSWR